MDQSCGCGVMRGGDGIVSTSLAWSKALISELPLLVFSVFFHPLLLCPSFAEQQFFVWTTPPVWDYKEPAFSWTESIMMLLGRNAKKRGGVFLRVELEEEWGVWQTTMSVFVFHVLIDLPWNIKMACNFFQHTDPLKCPEVLLVQFQLHVAL